MQIRENLIEKIQGLFDIIIEPKLKWTINALNLVQAIELSENLDTVHITLNLITDSSAEIEAFKLKLIEALAQLGIIQSEITIGRVNVGLGGIKGVKHILCVASGKGGVGKSSIAVNLAFALAKKIKVGLLDADIYGPSFATLFHCKQKPEVLSEEFLKPINIHGIPTMSMSYLVDPNKAIDWRGVLASGTLLQFIEKTLWGDLDLLIIDLPPGTSDIHLSLIHLLRSQVLLISSSEAIVQADVLRSLHFYQAREVPIIGILENFANHSEVLDQDNTSLAKTMVPVPLLGRLAHSPALIQANEAGLPLMVQNPEHLFCQVLDTTADKILKAFDLEVHEDILEEAAALELPLRA
jgi:ATP-binding protein involved in chromosome partitioning